MTLDHEPEGETKPEPGAEPVYRDWRDERRAERAQRRADRRSAVGWGGGPWVGGVILIVLGVVFLAQNMGYAILGNWWALFILLPAIGAFANAYSSYQRAGGRLTRAARGSLIGGLVLTFVAAVFLFDLNWGSLWPVFLILGGLAVLLNNALPADDETRV